MPPAPTTRYVWVNVNPRGMVHAEDCTWLNGVWAKQPAKENYRRMLATDAPTGKQHCSHC